MVQYRIVGKKNGAWWPEIYSEGQEETMNRDLEFLRERHPSDEYLIEARAVSDWVVLR